MNLSWRLERSVWEYPDHPAVIDADGTTVSYRELRALSNRIGNVLAAHGVGEDDVVVSAMPDHHLHVATLYATLSVGGAFSGLLIRAQRDGAVDEGILPAGNVSGAITGLIRVAEFIPALVDDAITVLETVRKRVAC